MIDYSCVCEKIKRTVLDCGQTMLGADADHLGVEMKDGINNPVTKYDKMIQKTLEEKLLSVLPGAYFVGEEDLDENAPAHSDAVYRYIVDPIDGTVNFARGLHMSAISVALLENGVPVIAVCFDPYTDELYEAIRGRGAYLNGKRLHVSDRLLKDGIFCSGSAPYYAELREKTAKIHASLYAKAADFRRTGSAVVELAALAAGRFELFFELRLMPWDYAAASLLIEEAGGAITTIDGDPLPFDRPTSVLATNAKEDYLQYLR